MKGKEPYPYPFTVAARVMRYYNSVPLYRGYAGNGPF